ncbi:MAG: hypothetical protein MJD61_01460 [Proteobacteria bacterium]|nr:hypothetical protein [Pseudomonadota bacterium]
MRTDLPQRRPRLRSRRIATVGLFLCALSAVAHAVSTRRFVLDSAKDLADGKLEGTAVHSNGSVTRSVDTTRMGLDEEALAYSMVRARDGTLYLGTGNQGRIYRVRGARIDLYAETKQLLVASLAIGFGGRLYAGTLPGGSIFEVRAKGRVRPFVELEGASHVWALHFDPQRKKLFAGTGPEGKIYEVTSKGRAKSYFDSDAAHVMCLGGDADGRLYAGTSDNALLLRLSGVGRAVVLHDFPGNEITALSVRDGEVAVAANEFPEPPDLTSKKSKPESSGKASNQAKRPKAGKGGLWLRARDGRVERLLASDEGHFTSVELAADGAIYAGHGTKGRVYRVTRDRTSAVWVEVAERQVLALGLGGKHPAFLAGDGAAVYRVLPPHEAESLWTSKALDAEFLSRWGELSWRAQGSVSLQTRSGNTELPGDTWSDWSSALATAGPVRSPAARFVQVRAKLTGRDSVLYALTLHYLPQNQRATVSDVRVAPSRKITEAKQAKKPLAALFPPPTARYRVHWAADSVDADPLRYRLHYRAEGQRVWRTMLPESEILTKNEYEWDTSGVPDGYYRVRVEASDERSNPERLHLTASALSEPVLIDNHAPSVKLQRPRDQRIEGIATDDMGPIANLAYAVDGMPWRVFFPLDGLLDTRRERFRLELYELPPGSHVVSIRATDLAGNSRSAETSLRGPGPRWRALGP